jgi:hypothetical protein
MARIRHLNRAPIAEAVIERRVRSMPPVMVENPNAFRQFLEKRGERRWGTPTSQPISSNRVNSP